MNSESDEEKALLPRCRHCGQPLPRPEDDMEVGADPGLCPFCRLEEESCGCSDEGQ